MKNPNDNPLYPTEAELFLVKQALKDALSENSIPMVTLSFAKRLTQLSRPNSEFISRLSAEMRQSSRFRFFLRNESNILEELGICISILLEEQFPEIEFSIEGREKSIFSELNKRISDMLEKKKDAPQIQDLLALRIIVRNNAPELDNIKKCYSIANLLLEYFWYYNLDNTLLSWDITAKPVNPLKDNRDLIREKYPTLVLPNTSYLDTRFVRMVKNYIFFPNSNGYKGLHLILVYRGIPVELQIRTITMHNWAENGPAKHKDYKKQRAFRDISLSLFDESIIKCPKYELCGEELIPYPGLVTPIRFFRYSN